MNKSYGVWEDVREDPGGGVGSQRASCRRVWEGAGGQGSEKGLGVWGVRGLRRAWGLEGGLGGVWGFQYGISIYKQVKFLGKIL